ncbi:MAG: hypothetical protein R3E39_09655 [Anaerolineae bacterium]
MMDGVGVFREEKGMAEAVEEVRALRQQYRTDLAVDDPDTSSTRM